MKEVHGTESRVWRMQNFNDSTYDDNDINDNNNDNDNDKK